MKGRKQRKIKESLFHDDDDCNNVICSLQDTNKASSTMALLFPVISSSNRVTIPFICFQGNKLALRVLIT